MGDIEWVDPDLKEPGVVWVTEDGKRFDTLKEVLEHNRRQVRTEDVPDKKETTEDEDLKEYWDVWGRDIPGAIAGGYLDQHLKAIVRAAYGRRDVIHGTKTLLPDPDTLKALKSDGKIECGPPGRQDDVPIFKGPLHFDQSLQGERHAFEYNGRWYRKMEIVGRVVLCPRGVMQQFEGIPIKITGVGPKTAKGVFLGWPPRKMTRGRSYESFQKGEEVYMPKAVLSEVLH